KCFDTKLMIKIKCWDVLVGLETVDNTKSVQFGMKQIDLGDNFLQDGQTEFIVHAFERAVSEVRSERVSLLLANGGRHGRVDNLGFAKFGRVNKDGHGELHRGPKKGNCGEGIDIGSLLSDVRR